MPRTTTSGKHFRSILWRLRDPSPSYRAMGNKDEAKAEFDKASSLHKARNDALLERMNGGHAQPAKDQAPPVTAPAQ